MPVWTILIINIKWLTPFCSGLRLFRLREFAGEDGGIAVLPFLMSAVHSLYARDEFLRFGTEVATILVLIIVAMAMAKPFLTGRV